MPILLWLAALGYADYHDNPPPPGTPASLHAVFPADEATGVPIDVAPLVQIVGDCDPCTVSFVEVPSGSTLPAQDEPLPGLFVDEYDVGALSPFTTYRFVVEGEVQEPTTITFETGDTPAPDPPAHTVDLQQTAFHCSYETVTEAVRVDIEGEGFATVEGDPTGLYLAQQDEYGDWEFLFLDDPVLVSERGSPEEIGEEVCATTAIRAVDGEISEPLQSCLAVPAFDPTTDCEIIEQDPGDPEDARRCAHTSTPGTAPGLLGVLLLLLRRRRTS